MIASAHRLIILSDLWGSFQLNWLDEYLHRTKIYRQVQFYDCHELGAIDAAKMEEGALHQQFIAGGIDRAVIQLCELEKDACDVLAFSIGGTIAWKAALRGLKVSRLLAVSATRLRYESERPGCHVNLIYGALDQYQPSRDWFLKMKLKAIIRGGFGHELYRDPLVAKEIMDMIIHKK